MISLKSGKTIIVIIIGIMICGVLEFGVLKLRRGVLELRFGVLELGVLELHLIACWNYGIGVLELRCLRFHL